MTTVRAPHRRALRTGAVLAIAALSGVLAGCTISKPGEVWIEAYRVVDDSTVEVYYTGGHCSRILAANAQEGTSNVKLSVPELISTDPNAGSCIAIGIPASDIVELQSPLDDRRVVRRDGSVIEEVEVSPFGSPPGRGNTQSDGIR